MEKEIVYTDKYALILSDEKPNTGEWFVPISGMGWELNVPRLADSSSDYNNKHCKKIIAHLPLFDISILILGGVPLLPPLPLEEDVCLLYTSPSPRDA